MSLRAPARAPTLRSRGTRPGSWRGAAFIAGSVLAHAALVAALLLRWPTADTSPAPGPAGTVEVVMVQQPATPPPTPASAPQPRSEDPAPPATPDAPAAQPATPPLPKVDAADNAPPPPEPRPPDPKPQQPQPPTPRPPAATPTSAPAAPPAVNLGEDAAEAWNVRSDNIQPPAPSASFRNLPPRYPAEAAARQERGTVGLLIHVAPDGIATGADVILSSGFPVLDREARRAVLLWRFDPAVKDGEAVPFDYPISIHFTR